MTDLAFGANDKDKFGHKLLTQMAGNIRRTLDLETIWRQTAESVGKAFSVSRCLVCSYQSLNTPASVVAEYRQSQPNTWLGQRWNCQDYPYLTQAIATLEPIVCTTDQTPDQKVAHILAIATHYQQQPNSLIILYRMPLEQRLDPKKGGSSSDWSEAEITFLKELVDHVGTAIAHASLFAESQSLTIELQQTNESLIRKQRLLEEALQQAEEGSRLKSEFLANTSHELRTPLNGIIGFLKLVLDGMADDPEEQRSFITEAHSSALHLNNIINDILDIAKIEAGKMNLDFSPVKLNELFNNLDNKTRLQAEQKGLTYEISLPGTRDEVMLYGDYQRLLQVMLNLVGNAIKFTHEGSISISANVLKKKFRFRDQSLPGLLEVRVADTGIGVSLDQQDKLFKSFSQVDSSRTRQYGGTGLGLAISQKFVEEMGGSMNFYSMGEGLGSTVTFTIPLYQEPLLVRTEQANSVNFAL